VKRSEKYSFKPAEDLVQQGKLTKAVEAYPPLLAAHPGYPAAHHNFATLLRKFGRVKDAILHSQIAYELSPDDPTIIFSFGLSQELGGFETEAERYYRKALSLRPDYTGVLNNLGKLLDQMERPLEALPFLQRAHLHEPYDRGVSLNLANAYLSLGRPEDAERLIGDDQSTTALNSLGIARYVRRDWTGAEILFRGAIRSDPNFAGAHENLALTLLHLRKFDAGWSEYEWRWKNSMNHLTKRLFDKPLWDGANLAGKTLLLHGEQGFGDTIQFVRYATFVEKNGGTILLACQEELTSLLRDAPGIDETFVLGDITPPFDCHAPLLSLPRLLGTYCEEIPKFDSYLQISDEMKLSRLSRSVLKIGICWAGRPRHVHDPHRNRSCPPNLFKALTELAGIELFGLPVDTPEKKEDLSFGLTELSPNISSFYNTAKAISALDLIVSVDTAVLHLAGALGKPGIAALCYAADWRWRDGNGIAPWYPSIHMIRQSVPGNWEEVFERISDHIKISYLT